MGNASKLVKDLSNVPSIIGALGINISEAQKALNVDYMDNLERMLGLIKAYLDPELAPPTDAAASAGTADSAATDADKIAKIKETTATVLKNLLIQLAPSRYQFSETTLAIRMDLAQSLDVVGSGGFSVGVGAVAVNAAMTVGFGYSYEAAAEVRTVLHAIPANDATFNELLNRAETLSEDALMLPAGKDIDQKYVDALGSVASKLAGEKLRKPEFASDSEG